MLFVLYCIVKIFLFLKMTQNIVVQHVGLYKKAVCTCIVDVGQIYSFNSMR